MIDSNKISADFQFVANRISKFLLETKDIDSKGKNAQVSFKYDYNILRSEEQEGRYLGYLEFISTIKAMIKNSILFKIDLAMEGVFVGDPKKLTLEKFNEMMELNGTATLSQLCRAYILSVSALSNISPVVKLPMINVLSLRVEKKKGEK
jgi:hypothetical protein